MSVVETSLGRVAARCSDGMAAFLGIPYAAPPTGTLRWQAPELPRPWTGIRDGSRFGSVAPQPGDTQAVLGAQSEDCLYLNVFVPEGHDEPLPVFLWFHGGGFVSGSGTHPWLHGRALIGAPAITVTANYRLGALGYLMLGDDFPESGSCGLADQVAVIDWVRREIATFGGDPSRITLAGHSAGAMSIGALLGVPGATRGIASAILMSGAASNLNTCEFAFEVYERVRDALGGRDRLLAAEPAALVRAQTAVANQMRQTTAMGQVFQPLVGGTLLPEPTLELSPGPGAWPQSLAVGTTTREMALFLPSSPQALSVDAGQVVRMLSRHWGHRGQEVFDVNRDHLPSGCTPWDVWVAAETNRVFWHPALQLADRAPTGGRTWLYQFGWPSPVVPEHLRAAHAIDVPFWWNAARHADARRLVGDAPDPALAATLNGALQRLVATGDPGWTEWTGSIDSVTGLGADVPAHADSNLMSILGGHFAHR